MPTTPLERLRARLAAERRLIVAYSGGVDSALLAFVAARELGDGALAVTAVSPSLAARERGDARTFTTEHAIAHVEVRTDEANRPEYRANAGDRCYHCKSALFDALAPIARLSGASVALGTNLDDLGDHRPGQRAAGERGVLSPLVDAGFDKATVRNVSHELGLRTATKPAAPCLASRVAYGETVTPDVLARIEAAEEAVRALGFSDLRVRAHSQGTVARIEVPAHQVERAATLRGELDARVRASGFTFCSLDLGGLSSGRMNAVLPLVEVTTGGTQ
ncbi:ATP-dependent sacrificial sulfur transferase LarE [Spiractinospora alimapuensis]|uniref:ATP-dependent sacrificial sulfur transferase LarE n=1 Tax=Spiractinospora alimapuensis TaxID=2820884 RepID=UPI001F44EAE2|nr:ATP-dependent sacrificial sulfur transferase LarE [Spiractinospora alimapuensis]QVQ52645.1 ATP-dependent sacrificial sulfur transferase LarE [Spiractinospora alimapuensis]